MKERAFPVTEQNEFQLEVVSVRLVKEAAVFSDRPFTDPLEAVAVLGEYMCQMDREVVAVVNLRADLIPINVSFVSTGVLDKVLVTPRELLKASFLSNASSLILVHNHPSGMLEPSQDDVELTDRMIKLCGLVGIPLVDHLIVGGSNHEFFSFCEKGMIKNPAFDGVKQYKDIQFQPPMAAEAGRGRR